MNELENLVGLVRKSKRYLLHGTILGVVVCLFGWYWVSQIPDEYTSTAKIYVDPNTILDNLLKGISVDSDQADQEFISYAYSQVTSRESIRQLVRAMDKDLQAQNASQMEQIIKHVRQNLALSLQSRGRNQGAKYLTISYTSNNPAEAKTVVSEAVDIFLHHAIGLSTSDSIDSLTFLESQITEHEGRLRDAEKSLEQFKREHLGMMPGASGDYFHRLQQVRDTIANTELALREEERRIAQIRNSVAQGSDGTDATMVMERMANLQDRLDALLLQYTDNHPDVISAKSQLEQLRQRSRELLANGGVITEDARSSQAVELSKAQANAATLQICLEEFRNREADLLGAAGTIPQVETELTQLTRNYQLFKDRYDSLVQRREAAVLAQQARIRSSSKVRLVEQPLVPHTPSNPPGYLLHSAVLMLGIGAGIAAAIGLAILRPTFNSLDDLNRNSDLPVLGHVAMQGSVPFGRDRMAAAGAVALALMIYVVIAIVPLIQELV